MPPQPRLGLQPGQRVRRRLLEHGAQGEAPFADPVARADGRRAGRKALAGDHEAAADRRGERAKHGLKAVAGAGRAGRGAQRQGQPATRMGGAFGVDGAPGQVGPRAQGGSPQAGHGQQVARQPRPHVFPEQRAAGPGERVGGGAHARVAGGLAQAGVQAEQRGQVVWLGGRRDADGPPEPGHPVGGLAAEAALRAQVDRGVGRAVEDEHLGVLGASWFRQAQGGARGPGAGRVVGDRAQGAQELPPPAHGSAPSVGRA